MCCFFCEPPLLAGGVVSQADLTAWQVNVLGLLKDMLAMDEETQILTIEERLIVQLSSIREKGGREDVEASKKLNIDKVGFTRSM